jgi:hypothetical protein
MKNIITKLLFFLSLSLVLLSCDKRELIELKPDATTVVTLSETDLVLSSEMGEQEVLTVTWNEPDFGFDAGATYKVLLDFADGDFSEPQTFAVGNSLEKVFKADEINSKLLSLGAKPEEANELAIKVLIVLSNYSNILSDAVNISVTPYTSFLDLTTNWGVVGSATPNGWDGPDIPFYQTGVENVYNAYATLATGEIKFRENNDWALNYGDNDNDGTLEEGGDNIPVSEGSYKITINLNNLTWSMEAFSWGIVGSATPNGWDGQDVAFNYDPFSDTFKTVVTLTTGEIKFRQNNDWTVNYGDTGADGTLEANGDNIPVDAGHYLVTLDFSDATNPVYSIEAKDLWGVVGSATPNGWDGPDTKFTPDFGGNDGLFYIKNISLTTGEIKFRLNDDWGVNYGGSDGNLISGGANIAVDAGVYDITLDFSDEANPKYTIE